MKMIEFHDRVLTVHYETYDKEKRQKTGHRFLLR